MFKFQWVITDKLIWKNLHCDRNYSEKMYKCGLRRCQFSSLTSFVDLLEHKFSFSFFFAIFLTHCLIHMWKKHVSVLLNCINNTKNMTDTKKNNILCVRKRKMWNFEHLSWILMIKNEKKVLKWPWWEFWNEFVFVVVHPLSKIYSC